jgi:hypothetical protein
VPVVEPVVETVLSPVEVAPPRLKGGWVLGAWVVAVALVPGGLNKLAPGSELGWAGVCVEVSAGLDPRPANRLVPPPMTWGIRLALVQGERTSPATPMDGPVPVVGALKTMTPMSTPSSSGTASCSQVEVAGFAALSAGLLPPRRLPAFEPPGAPVAAAVVLPVAFEVVALPKKLPPVAPPEAVLLEPPVPEPKMPPPVVAGLAAGNPKKGPEWTQVSIFETKL